MNRNQLIDIAYTNGYVKAILDMKEHMDKLIENIDLEKTNKKITDVKGDTHR